MATKVDMQEQQEFELKNRQMIAQMRKSADLEARTRQWFSLASKFEYSYHFTWLGRPIIQFPQDIVALQEIIWKVKPDLVIETGIARGGSLIFHASMLELLGDGEVVGIDIDIRSHNREEIERHPLFKRIHLIEGSSVAPDVIRQVSELARGKKRILVVLDSNHTRDHVAQELALYAPFVKKDSYLIAYDTVIEFMSAELTAHRPWGPGDNPYTAVKEFLKATDRFEVDEELEGKLLITVAPSGYLKCVKD